MCNAIKDMEILKGNKRQDLPHQMSPCHQLPDPHRSNGNCCFSSLYAMNKCQKVSFPVHEIWLSPILAVPRLYHFSTLDSKPAGNVSKDVCLQAACHSAARFCAALFLHFRFIYLFFCMVPELFFFFFSLSHPAFLSPTPTETFIIKHVSHTQ